MTENKKAARARYTLEFKQEAVRLVESGQSIAAAARTVDIAEQTLFNWVKAQRQGRLSGIASSRTMSAEQMEMGARHFCGRSSGLGSSSPVILKLAAQAITAKGNDGIGAP